MGATVARCSSAHNKAALDAAMVTCVRGDGKGRAAARAHRGLSLDGEWGERESSQARVPVMRDDIDSWSRPRLAERLSVVGLRAHVAGDARPQLTRRGDDDGEEHHGVERSGTALFGLARVSGLGTAWARVFCCIRAWRWTSKNIQNWSNMPAFLILLDWQICYDTIHRRRFFLL